jgi:hypothetical protein
VQKQVNEQAFQNVQQPLIPTVSQTLVTIRQSIPNLDRRIPPQNVRQTCDNLVDLSRQIQQQSHLIAIVSPANVAPEPTTTPNGNNSQIQCNQQVNLNTLNDISQTIAQLMSSINMLLQSAQTDQRDRLSSSLSNLNMCSSQIGMCRQQIAQINTMTTNSTTTTSNETVQVNSENNTQVTTRVKVRTDMQHGQQQSQQIAVSKHTQSQNAMSHNQQHSVHQTQQQTHTQTQRTTRVQAEQTHGQTQQSNPNEPRSSHPTPSYQNNTANSTTNSHQTFQRKHQSNGNDNPSRSYIPPSNAREQTEPMSQHRNRARTLTQSHHQPRRHSEA